MDVGMYTYTHICTFYREAVSPPLFSTRSICHDSHVPKDKPQGYHFRTANFIMSLLHYSVPSTDTGYTLQSEGKSTCSLPFFMLPHLSHTHMIYEKLSYFTGDQPNCTEQNSNFAWEHTLQFHCGIPEV